jgi:hypothetical protein
MITKTFIGTFNGQLSKIENIAFRPPIPIRKSGCYVVTINQITGHTKWHEVFPAVPMDRMERLFGRIG